MNSLTKAIALKDELDLLRLIPKEHEELIMQKYRLDWNYHTRSIKASKIIKEFLN